MSLLSQASLVVTPNAFKASKLYSVIPSDGSGDMTSARATTATRVNENGLIETVASNVPRIDYTSGEASILLEPQRTNLITYPISFGNAYWTKSGATVVSGQASPSVDYPTSAFKLVENTSVSDHRIDAQGIATSSGSSYTLSMFLKKTDERNWFKLRDFITNAFINVNLSNGTIGSTNLVNNTQKIETFDNNWYRVSFTFTASSSVALRLYIGESDNNTNYQGDGTSGVYIYGAQVEQGSYPTSLTFTSLSIEGSTVTRNADVISKTGISDLIGQTEGTIFVDAKTFINPVDFSSFRRCYLILTDGTFNNRIEISKFGSNNILLNNDIKVRISSSGSTIFDQTVATNFSGNLKLALAYKSGSTIVYINGVNVYEYNTTYTAPTTSFINVGNGYNQPTTDSLNYISIWKTALTDQECINLTTL